MAEQYLNTLHELRAKVAKFQQRLEEQRADDGTLFTEASSSLNEANDAAFEGLEGLVEQLVQIADGDAPVGKDAVPRLPVAIDLFHKLAKTCEASVDSIGQEFVDTTQYGGENKQVQDDIQSLLSKIDADILGARTALRRAESTTRDRSESLERAEGDLRDARNKRDGWYDISSFFGGGGDIDSQVHTNEMHVENCERDLEDARRVESECRNNLASLEHLIPMAQDVKRLLEELFWQMNSEYEKIVKDRKIIERTWEATRALDYHVSTNDVDTSRDDILRHVVQLIHMRVEQVDEDPDVQRFKENIERRMREALGEAEVEKLHQEKKFLPLEDDNF